jgi:hypothetical protein
MKNILCILVCTLALFGFMLPATTMAQTATATMTVSVNGANCDVSVFLERTGGTSFNLGDCSFVFAYNTSALTYNSELAEGIFDNGTSTDYQDQYSSSYTGGYRSVEIALNPSVTGTTVPASPTLVGTLRFTITNSSANHNVAWYAPFSAVTTVAGGNVTMTWSSPNNGPLPVQLTTFSASANQSSGNVMLKWATASETNNYGFEVQKAATNSSSAYATIANSFVAGHGTTVDAHSYSYTDANASGAPFYRLKQTDLDGTIHYSDGVQATTVTSVEERPLPTSYAMEQNYPNPFNPSTTIDFALPKDSHVTLKIYNAVGQEVATLLDGIRPAGYHSISFNAMKLSSGLYFYRLTAGQSTFLRKMMLVK